MLMTAKAKKTTRKPRWTPAADEFDPRLPAREALETRHAKAVRLQSLVPQIDRRLSVEVKYEPLKTIGDDPLTLNHVYHAWLDESWESPSVELDDSLAEPLEIQLAAGIRAQAERYLRLAAELERRADAACRIAG